MWRFVFGIFFEVFAIFSKKLVNLQQKIAKFRTEKKDDFQNGFWDYPF